MVLDGKIKDVEGVDGVVWDRGAGGGGCKMVGKRLGLGEGQYKSYIHWQALYLC